jgi:alpha-D-ribose 1-methylphosphonate 5-phosphate C-P lyase
MMLDARQSVLELALAVGEKIVQRVPQVEPARSLSSRSPRRSTTSWHAR